MPTIQPRPVHTPGPPVNAASTDQNLPAVQGTSLTSTVPLESKLGAGVGVVGASGSGTGVQAMSDSGVGLQATSSGGNAVQATCTADTDAIIATSSSPNHAAVSGWNNGGGYGLWASSTNKNGKGGIGIYATGAKYAGQFDGQVVVAGELSAISGSATYAISALGLSRFQGSIQVTDDINVGGDVVLSGADCAEEFDIARIAEIDAGTVMVLADDGSLEASKKAYDNKVAGVISGAGEYRPGLILDRRDSSQKRLPVALIGKVYCKVDAQYAPIEVGDLLTTSPTPGHAMRATDPTRAFGTVIGKALRRLDAGQTLMPILVALQ